MIVDLFVSFRVDWPKWANWQHQKCTRNMKRVNFSCIACSAIEESFCSRGVPKFMTEIRTHRLTVIRPLRIRHQLPVKPIHWTRIRRLRQRQLQMKQRLKEVKVKGQLENWTPMKWIQQGLTARRKCPSTFKPITKCSLILETVHML